MSGYMCPSFCMCDSCSTTHVPLTQKGSDRDMLNTIYKLEQRLKEAEKVLTDTPLIHVEACGMKVGEDIDCCTCHVRKNYDYFEKYREKEEV